jgi:hypothetical protein
MHYHAHPISQRPFQRPSVNEALRTIDTTDTYDSKRDRKHVSETGFVEDFTKKISLNSWFARFFAFKRSFNDHRSKKTRARNSATRPLKTYCVVCVAFTVFVFFLLFIMQKGEGRILVPDETLNRKNDRKKETNANNSDEEGEAEEEEEEEERPSLETALLGSSLVVDEPGVYSGFKQMSYPAAAEIGDSRNTYLVAFEGNWDQLPQRLSERELEQRDDRFDDINESRGGSCFVARGRVPKVSPGSDVAPKETWHQPKMVVKGSTTDRCWRPNVFVVPATKEVLLFYKRGATKEQWEGFMKRSLDGGKTWMDEEKLPPGILGPTKNKVLINSEDESILSPSERWTRSSACTWIERAENEGRDWTIRSGPIRMEKKSSLLAKEQGRSNAKATLEDEEAFDYAGIEPAIFYKDDGTLVALARPAKTNRFPKSLLATASSMMNKRKNSSRKYSSPKILKAELKDEPNAQWSTFKETDIELPTIFARGFDVEKLTDGRVVLVMNDPGKKGVSVKISKDDGETFKEAFVIEDDTSSSSSDGDMWTRDPVVRVANDAMIHVFYVSANGRKIKSVKLDPEQL